MPGWPRRHGSRVSQGSGACCSCLGEQLPQSPVGRVPGRQDSPPVSPQPLCPKELWHFVHQCYGSELGLTSDDEDYVPPDDDFNTMG